MKILIFNWRDIKNPLSGGAEVLTHENAKRWVKAGHEVTLFTSAFPQCLEKETIDGINIIRSGNKYTVYWQACRYYKRYFQGKFDLVIDEINTVPFLTPLYVKEPLLAHINQLAREIWFYEIPFPLSLLGFLIEPWCLKAYRNIPIITISQSSKEDLLNLGFSKINIQIIPMGMSLQVRRRENKEKEPTLIWVNRVIKSKRLDHTLKAFEYVKRKIPNTKLWIVGPFPPPYQDRLQRLVQRLGLKDVTFYNFVEERRKQELIQKAHLIVSTSVREGWGLTITEANALGTPAVVYNVAGLRDSTKNNETGLICEKNTPRVLAENIIKLLKNKSLYRKLQEGAYRWGKDFNWDRSAQESLSILEKIAKQRVTKTPLVSIIIPVKRNNKNLQECLNHCQRLDYPNYEIIVLPDKREELSHSQVKVIPTGAIGPSEKRDIGIRHAQGEILAFLDDDAFPTKDWLKNGIPYFEDENVAALGGPGVTPPNDGLREEASGLVYSSLLAAGSASYRYVPKREREVDDFPTCNLLIRKSIMDSLGGFGVKFWPGEDTKLCLHIVRDLGKKIIYTPKFLVYHHRRSLFIPHLRQVRGYALHRGYFAKRFPHTSRRFPYFTPSLFVIGLFLGWLLGLIQPFFYKVYFGVLLFYLLLVLLTSLKNKNPKKALLVFLGIIATNLTYGAFFLKGLFSRRLKEE